MGQTAQRALIIVLVAGALGLLNNALSQKGIPLVTPPKKLPTPDEFIPLDQARGLWNAGNALFFDARKPEDFEAGHILNARNLPAEDFEQNYVKIAPMLTPESTIVVYCDGTECDLSHRLADQLRQLGYTNVHMIFNGWTSWQKAGFPTEAGPTK